jgi:acyl-CoA synthetase (AMP-forming)/AMP-acid ligase II
VLPYSSGTTGRPKGVKQPLTGGPAVAESPLARMYMQLYQAGADTVFLSAGPLYHTAPLAFCMSVHRVGGTVVLMEKFDPLKFLDAIDTHAVTHTQMVPTMFVRLLKLPESERERYRLSSLRYAIHAAAPCPVPVKRSMIQWWGPVLHEYYGGTEAIGSTAIDSEQWLRKPGSVGKANWGVLHICDESGRELPAGETGLVYFGGAAQFAYHNDADKTAESRHPQHGDWATLGDIGHVDEDGYLFLSDRRSFMIISGGVNIYPQETENVLIMHPRVADAAVIGVPNEEFGEEVKAIVQPQDWADANETFASELIAYCRAQLSPIKCPRSIDFDPALPREANGKLYKKRLRERYWRAQNSEPPASA